MIVGDLKAATSCRESQRGHGTVETDEFELVPLTIELNSEPVAPALDLHIV